MKFMRQRLIFVDGTVCAQLSTDKTRSTQSKQLTHELSDRIMSENAQN